MPSLRFGHLAIGAVVAWSCAPRVINVPANRTVDASSPDATGDLASRDLASRDLPPGDEPIVKPGPLQCFDDVTPQGLPCQRCFDENKNPVSDSCVSTVEPICKIGPFDVSGRVCAACRDAKAYPVACLSCPAPVDPSNQPCVACEWLDEKMVSLLTCKRCAPLGTSPGYDDCYSLWFELAASPTRPW